MSLPTPEFRIVAPPADGLAGAFRAAAHRRRRKAATTGGAGVLTAAVVFAVLTGGTGQVLTSEPVVPADEAPGLVELVPAGPQATSAPEQLSGTAPQSPGTAPGAASQPGMTGVGTAPSEAPRAAAGGTAAHRPVAAKPPYRTGAVTRRDDDIQLSSDVGCVVEANSGADRLCSEVYDLDGELTVLLCNHTPATRNLTFLQQAEVDFVVQGPDGDEVWRWSRDHRTVEDVHIASVSAGRCTTWSTTWGHVSGSGARLPAGNYVLRASILSDDAGSARSSSGATTVTEQSTGQRAATAEPRGQLRAPAAVRR